MNILIINHEFPPIGGGGGVFTKLLGLGLSKINHKIYILTIGEKNCIERINKNLKIIRIESNRKSKSNIHNFEIFGVIKVFKKVIKGIIKKYKIDIINPHFIHTSGLAEYYSHNNLPKIITCLGADIYDPTRYSKIRKIMNYYAKRIIDKGSKLVVSSNDMFDRALKLNNDFKNKIVIIPHCINTVLYSDKKNGILEKKYGISKENKTIISVCRLIKRKNLEKSIDIIAELIKSNYKIKYLIIGSGPEKENLQNKINSMNLNKHIIFSGYVSDEELVEINSDADIFMLTSFHEAFGIAVLEAMASGNVPICSSVGGWNDFIINNETGFICDSKNEFIEKITLLLNDKNVYKIMSEKAKLKSVKEYNYLRIAEKYSELFMNSL